MRGTPIERFEQFVSTMVVDKCWDWLGAIDKKTGYGAFWDGTKREWAHRASYRLYVGTLKTGLTIDHLCRNRKCVNPEHLEAVSNRTNNLRGESTAARHARQTHCKRGHELSGDNLLIHKSNKLGRQRNERICRLCAYFRRYGKWPNKTAVQA